MSDDDTERLPIKSLETNRKREGLHTVAESSASLDSFGVGGTQSRLHQMTHPPQSEIDRQTWQKSISEKTKEHSNRINEHDRHLNPTKTLKGAAAQLISALARDCPNGLGDKNYGLDEMCSLLPDVERQAVEDAAFDLKNYGLINTKHAVGGHWWARLTPKFYQQIDKQLMGWNNEQDALSLARMILDTNEGRAASLHEASGWDKRRFNPAFRTLLTFFPAKRASREIQPNYPAASILVLPEDRARLRQILEIE